MQSAWWYSHSISKWEKWMVIAKKMKPMRLHLFNLILLIMKQVKKTPELFIFLTDSEGSPTDALSVAICVFWKIHNFEHFLCSVIWLVFRTIFNVKGVFNLISVIRYQPLLVSQFSISDFCNQRILWIVPQGKIHYARTAAKLLGNLSLDNDLQ